MWTMALNYVRLHTKKTRDRFNDVIQRTHLMLFSQKKNYCRTMAVNTLRDYVKIIS